MAKKLLFILGLALFLVLAYLIFRFFYLKGSLSFGFSRPVLAPFSETLVSPSLEQNSPESSPIVEISSEVSPEPSMISESPLVSIMPSFQSEPSFSVSPTPSPSLVPRGKLVTIDVNDFEAGMYQVDVKNGVKVSLTINVVNFNVSHGGLDFRSPKVSTGVIPSGQSRKVEFIMETDLVFTPHYADSGLIAPYTIKFNLIP